MTLCPTRCTLPLSYIRFMPHSRKKLSTVHHCAHQLIFGCTKSSWLAGIAPNVILVTTMMSAARKAGKSQLALQLFEQCDELGLQRDVACYNAASG